MGGADGVPVVAARDRSRSGVAPVAIYLLATGSIWQGVVLIAYGALVIGLVDNFLRPILVGKDTKMPDYVVLISTLGGIEAFGLNGFVIGPVIAAMFIAVWTYFPRRDKTTPSGSEDTGVVFFDQGPLLNTVMLSGSVATPRTRPRMCFDRFLRA